MNFSGKRKRIELPRQYQSDPNDVVSDSDERAELIHEFVSSIISRVLMTARRAAGEVRRQFSYVQRAPTYLGLSSDYTPGPLDQGHLWNSGPSSTRRRNR